MTKYDFLNALRKELAGMKAEDIEKSVQFYSELIDDSMENGQTEEEAVASLGSLEDIVRQICSENEPEEDTAVEPEMNAEQTETTYRKLTTLEIILLIVTIPVWGGLLIGILGVYISLWGVVIGLYATAGSLTVAGIAAAVSAPFIHAGLAVILMQIGVGLLMTGISIPFFMLDNMISKLLVLLVKWTIHSVRELFRRGISS